MYMNNYQVRPFPCDLVFRAPVLNFSSPLTGEELYAASTTPMVAILWPIASKKDLWLCCHCSPVFLTKLSLEEFSFP